MAFYFKIATLFSKQGKLFLCIQNVEQIWAQSVACLNVGMLRPPTEFN